MLNLIKNEWMKIFRRPGTYVMIGLLLFMVTITGAFIKYQEQGGSVPDNQNWEQGLLLENESLKKQMEELGDRIPENTLLYYERQIALNEYRMEHHISPNEEYSVWSFVKDTSLMIDFAGLFTIIIAAGIVASEFNWGTIKLLLIRPINRARILGAKFMMVLLFGFLMLFLLFAYSTLLGAVLFGFPENPAPYLSYYQGSITEQSMPLHLFSFYCFESISMYMLAAMAFMISAVFRNNSLAIGLSLFLMFTGRQATELIAMKFSWAKYVLFANTDLMQYFTGVPMVEGMTLPFSVFMLLIYFILFLYLAYIVFKKRDVAS
ncbi:ABC transporter permease [Bacillus tuaregi]|uniref:ABC transporter permease n=1 Tax=Bacillus tuaregi TaxID=1816695 RepID=UPI0008F941BF|nr:ABC transporter permease [Bacillus tuaregi]